MSFVLASFRKDLSRWRRDLTAILIWLAIPFMIGGLMTVLFSGDNGGGPSGTLLIADQDDTLLSGLVAATFAQDQLGEMFTVQAVSVDQGAAQILAGEASGFLIIPKGFQDAFLNDKPITLTLKTNPSQTILPGIIRDVTEILMELGFYLQSAFGAELKAIRNEGGSFAPDDVFVASIAVQIQHKIETLGPKLSPPVIDLEIVAPPTAAPRPDLGILFLPGIVMMALLFASQGLSADFWVEREKGTLRRLVAAPALANRFVLGKTMAAAVVVTLITGTTLSLGFAYHDLPWAKLLPSLLWISLAGVAFFAWFSSLQMLFATKQAASLLTTIVLFPLMMVGGSFFPLDALPDWLAAIGRLSPNGFVVDRLTGELLSAGAWSFDKRSWLILLAMTFSGLALCNWRLRNGFANR
jgi:ABC-type multidrug transport system permease subunit